jgi:hypothetical protein
MILWAPQKRKNTKLSQWKRFRMNKNLRGSSRSSSREVRTKYLRQRY